MWSERENTCVDSQSGIGMESDEIDIIVNMRSSGLLVGLISSMSLWFMDDYMRLFTCIKVICLLAIKDGHLI